MADSPAAGSPNTARVLLIEHEEASQLMARSILRHLGYLVDVASDGAQALDMAEEKQYEAIFVNCEVPVVNGYDLARRWRRRERSQQDGTHTPIIAMTGSIVPGDRDRCLAAGMDDYLIKPIHAETVGTSLSRWLGTAIDSEQIERLRDLRAPGGGSPLPEMIQSFLAHGPAAIEDLARALSQRDTAALAPLAQSLKGMASAVGATALAEICSALAAQGRVGDLDAATATLDRMRAEFDRAQVELQRIAARTT